MMAKRLLSIILIVILCFACIISVKSAFVEIDGYVNERAWHSAQTQILVSGSGISNCDVDFATVQVLLDEDNHLVYLGLKARLSTAVPDLEAKGYGVRISINGGEFVEFTSLSSDDYDLDSYNYTVGFSSSDGARYNAEILLGVKYGLEALESIEVRFIDGFGVPSNVYEVALPELLSEQTTSADLLNTTSLTSKPQNTTDSISTTRKTTTSKVSTTKQRTTARTTSAKSKVSKTKAEKTSRQINNQTASAKTVVVYVTVTEPSYSESQNTVSEKSSAAAQASQNQNAQTVSRPNKVLAYLGVAALLVITFGVIVVVNINAERKAQEQGKKK